MVERNRGDRERQLKNIGEGSEELGGKYSTYDERRGLEEAQPKEMKKKRRGEETEHTEIHHIVQEERKQAETLPRKRFRKLQKE